MGMHYVVSDIHGNKEAWELIKRKINLTDDDTLYILGDVIDRGEYGIEILREIMNTPNMKMLLGNHEYMMLNALGKPYDEDEPGFRRRSRNHDIDLWYYNGGDVTHQAYEELTDAEQDKITAYLLGLPLNISVTVGDETCDAHSVSAEAYAAAGMSSKLPGNSCESKLNTPLRDAEHAAEKKYILVHANLEAVYDSFIDKSHMTSIDSEILSCGSDSDVHDIRRLINKVIREVNAGSKAYFCVWDRDFLIPLSVILRDDVTVIFGHTPTINLQNKSGSYMSIYDGGNVIGIDCGAAYGRKYGGRLACIRLEDGKLFYSQD